MATYGLKGYATTYTSVPGLTLNSMADGGTDDSTVIDLGSGVAPYLVSFHATLDGSGANNTGALDIYVKWSATNPPIADTTNQIPAGAVYMNGATNVQKDWTVPVEARYLIVAAVNNSGTSLASSANALTYGKIYQTPTG